MPKKVEDINQQEFIEKLEERLNHSDSQLKRWTFLRKKYSWLFIVQGSRIFKRIMDILLSTLLMIILSPLLLLIILAIKLTDGGEAIYVTNRVGKWGREFRFPKFRTMRLGSDRIKSSFLEPDDGKRFKLKEDPRITPVGLLLRRFSLDELPQLWCVLKGDMSLVGPRPPLPEEVMKYTMKERRRLDVRPGITCFWQISGRSELTFNQQVELDLKYIQSRSILVDFKILLQTIPAVLFGRGAY